MCACHFLPFFTLSSRFSSVSLDGSFVVSRAMMCNTLSHGIDYTRILRTFVFFWLLSRLHAKPVRKFPECRQFLVRNDCYYFPCLDAHYQCGRDSHLTRFSYDLCLVSTKKYVPQLTESAQSYFNQTNICLTKSLQDQLVETSISGRFTCTQLEALIVQNSLRCFRNRYRENSLSTMIDFCSIMCGNLQTMINLFLNLNSDSLDLHRLLIETGKSCGAKINESVPPTVPSLLLSVCLDRTNARLPQDITSVMLSQRFEFTDYDWISG